MWLLRAALCGFVAALVAFGATRALDGGGDAAAQAPTDTAAALPVIKQVPGDVPEPGTPVGDLAAGTASVGPDGKTYGAMPTAGLPTRVDGAAIAPDYIAVIAPMVSPSPGTPNKATCSPPPQPQQTTKTTPHPGLPSGPPTAPPSSDTWSPTKGSSPPREPRLGPHPRRTRRHRTRRTMMLRQAPPTNPRSRPAATDGSTLVGPTRRAFRRHLAALMAVVVFAGGLVAAAVATTAAPR